MEKSNFILILTHGNMGKEMLVTASMFTLIDREVAFLGLNVDENIKDYQKKIEKFINDNSFVLILTDMLTATTTRVSALLLKYENVEIVTGLNLVMLLCALREKSNFDLKTLAEVVKQEALEDIIDIRRFMQLKNKNRKE